MATSSHPRPTRSFWRTLRTSYVSKTCLSGCFLWEGPKLIACDGASLAHSVHCSDFRWVSRVEPHKGITTGCSPVLTSQVRSRDPTLDLEDVVRETLKQVEGAYAVCFLFADQPNLLIGARKGSPLILGIGKDKPRSAAAETPDVASLEGLRLEPVVNIVSECFLASDASAIIEYTNKVPSLAVRVCGCMLGMMSCMCQVVYIEEDDLCVIRRLPSGDMSYVIEPIHVVKTPDYKAAMFAKSMPVHHLELTLEAIEKGGYKHFMLKEIMSQPKLLEDCMRGRVNPDSGTIRLGGLEKDEIMSKFCAASRIIVCACGTSFHSGLVGEYLMESMARIPVEVEYASEFRYRNPILDANDIVVVISQSGETADTLAALKLAKERGCLTVGIINVVGSSIARETDAGIYLHVGPEIGVASTKAFTGQVLVLTMMALLLGYKRGVLAEAEYNVSLTPMELLALHVDYCVFVCVHCRHACVSWQRCPARSPPSWSSATLCTS